MPLHAPRAGRRRANSHPVGVHAAPRNRSDLPTPNDTSPFTVYRMTSGSESSSSSSSSSSDEETINDSDVEHDLESGNAWTSRIPSLPVIPSASPRPDSSNLASRVSYVASLLTPLPTPPSTPPIPPTMAQSAAEDQIDLELITSTAYTSRNLRRRGAVHIRRTSGGAGVVGVVGNLGGELRTDAEIASRPNSLSASIRGAPRQQQRRRSVGGRAPRAALAQHAVPARRSMPGDLSWSSSEEEEEGQEEEEESSKETYTLLCGHQGQESGTWRSSAVAFSSEQSPSTQIRGGCGAIVTAAARYLPSSGILWAPSSQTNIAGSSRIRCSIW
jgi:hypothetical protein